MDFWIRLAVATFLTLENKDIGIIAGGGQPNVKETTSCNSSISTTQCDDGFFPTYPLLLQLLPIVVVGNSGPL